MAPSHDPTRRRRSGHFVEQAAAVDGVRARERAVRRGGLRSATWLGVQSVAHTHLKRAVNLKKGWPKSFSLKYRVLCKYKVFELYRIIE